MSERAGDSQSYESSPNGVSSDEVVEWSEGEEPHVGISEDDFSNDPATHGVAVAAELLDLREALSEKELQILEMQQAHFSLANDEDLNAKAQTAARKELSSKMRESAVRAKAKIRVLRAELKAAREAAAAEREATGAERAAGASARDELATYREKWVDEKRAAAVAEAVAEKAKEHVGTAREERAEAREERDAARRDTLEKTRELSALREATEPTRRESEVALDEARRAAARFQAAATAAEAELAEARDELRRVARREGKATATANDRALTLLKQNADERVHEAITRETAAIEEAAMHASIAKEAVAKAEAVARSSVELKAKTQALIDRVTETQRHALHRTEAAARHKANARELRRQLADARTAMSTAATTRELANVDPSARDAVAEASSTLADAMKQCFAVGAGEDPDGETLRRWLAGITGFGGDTASVNGAALLATAQRAAGALVAATSRAAAAERAAEDANEITDAMRVELEATRAERDASCAALGREKAVSRNWEDVARRAESSLAASRDELGALRTTVADEDARAAIGQGDIEAKIKRLETWDTQKAQLGAVIQRLASRTFGAENAEQGKSASAFYSITKHVSSEKKQTVASKTSTQPTVRVFR
jgi:hypothetical protein